MGPVHRPSVVFCQETLNHAKGKSSLHYGAVGLPGMPLSHGGFLQLLFGLPSKEIQLYTLFSLFYPFYKIRSVGSPVHVKVKGSAALCLVRYSMYV